MLLKGAVEAFKCLSVINVRVWYCDKRVCCRQDTFGIVCSV